MVGREFSFVFSSFFTSSIRLIIFLVTTLSSILVLGNNASRLSGGSKKQRDAVNKQLLARHMGIFTELGVLPGTARRLDKLMEHIKISPCQHPLLAYVMSKSTGRSSPISTFDEVNNVPELPGFFLPEVSSRSLAQA